MPVYRCSFDALEETIERIDKQGEQIVSIAQSGDSCAIVTNAAKRAAGGVEKR